MRALLRPFTNPIGKNLIREDGPRVWAKVFTRREYLVA